jgi:hypothetical protein
LTNEETTEQELGADQWRDRMLFISTELLKAPRDRPLTEEEHVEIGRAALALAEMFVTLDEKLVGGFVPPRAWMRDVPEPGQLPTSELHRNLKTESEVIVQKLLMAIEKKVLPFDKKTAPLMMELLGKLLSTLALFTSESVRLACLNNVKAETQENAPRLALVHDANVKGDN